MMQFENLLSNVTCDNQGHRGVRWWSRRRRHSSGSHLRLHLKTCQMQRARCSLKAGGSWRRSSGSCRYIFVSVPVCFFRHAIPTTLSLSYPHFSLFWSFSPDYAIHTLPIFIGALNTSAKPDTDPVILQIPPLGQPTLRGSSKHVRCASQVAFANARALAIR